MRYSIKERSRRDKILLYEIVNSTGDLITGFRLVNEVPTSRAIVKVRNGAETITYERLNTDDVDVIFDTPISFTFNATDGINVPDGDIDLVRHTFFE